MPTVILAASAKYPTVHASHAIDPMEGVSLLPTFSGQRLVRDEPIFFNHEDNRAVRDGQWKMVALAGQPWELYDINADRTELNNLALQQPDRVAAMSAQYDTWAKRTRVVTEDDSNQSIDTARKKRKGQNGAKKKSLK